MLRVSRLKGCNGHVWAKVGRRVRASGVVLARCWSSRCYNHHACGSWAVVHHVHLHRGRGIESDYKKSLGRIFGAATPPGALVCIMGVAS